MGYPMTFKRVVQRNNLVTGDYDTSPKYHSYSNPVWDKQYQNEELLLDIIKHYTETVNRLNDYFKRLAGDLRRLEHDVVDEDALCSLIANRTKIEPDVVAAVLKEFMSI